jgi:hypothetical protein
MTGQRRRVHGKLAQFGIYIWLLEFEFLTTGELIMLHNGYYFALA